MKPCNPILQLFLPLFLWLPLVTTADSTDPSWLITQLQQGGHVIYLRHAATDHNQSDLADLKLDDCSTQRNLSETGHQQARNIGAFFRHNHIPIGRILSSPFCRCRDTAQLAFPERDDIELQDSLFFSINASEKQRLWQNTWLTRLLTTIPANRTNLLIVSHTANLKDATGIWPKPEGAFYVFKPDGKRFNLIGHLTPSQLANISEP